VSNVIRLANWRAGRQDWSRRELARFHRAANLLRKNGISVDTDLGVTDEGEPWFVFCDTDSGEPVAHFARIGRQYVACGPFLNERLAGGVLADLAAPSRHGADIIAQGAFAGKTRMDLQSAADRAPNSRL
jgi:hypothetical protein